ncbi:hypothetical protein FRC08_010819 [Ceratobasidium sp. 394]|nr:hypothetical protein FRC08_010819 [Ceratobasidium sp. 394]KAG9091765.1 hypothetical protein FS749_016295 [Ceratobasidium sp. UAMH 11750]
MSSYSYASSSASTTTLVSHPHQQPRDYSAAFGALASSYGSSGAAPCRPSSKTASHLSSSGSNSSSKLRALFSRRSTPTSQSVELYVVPKSQDFGALMNKYGAGGFGPTHSVL